MKKYNLLLLTLFISTFFISCGGDTPESDESSSTSNETEVEAPLNTVDWANVNVGNSDSKYFKVSEGSSEITWGEYDQIYYTVEFEVVKTYTGKLGCCEKEQAFIEILALDADENEIKLMSTTRGAMRPNDSDGSKFADFLRGEPGSTKKFKFSGSVGQEGNGFETDKDKTTAAAKKITGFDVYTEYK